MTRVASLGMYDLPWLAGPNDALWAAIGARLRERGVRDVPGRLDRTRGLEAIWHDPGLLLAQTCGLPLVTTLAGMVQVVAIPRYALPGCDGAWHRSFVVVRADDPARTLASLRGRRCAINGRDSNSGMNVLRAAVAPLARQGRFFASIVATGAHLESLRAVREDRADVAAIDCVTHGLVARCEPGLLRGTRVLAWTAGTPALPLVTARSTTPTELALLRKVVTDSALTPLCEPLGLAGFAVSEPADYAAVSALARVAAEAEYPELA